MYRDWKQHLPIWNVSLILKSTINEAVNELFLRFTHHVLRIIPRSLAERICRVKINKKIRLDNG